MHGKPRLPRSTAVFQEAQLHQGPTNRRSLHCGLWRPVAGGNGGTPHPRVVCGDSGGEGRTFGGQGWPSAPPCLIRCWAASTVRSGRFVRLRAGSLDVVARPFTQTALLDGLMMAYNYSTASTARARSLSREVYVGGRGPRGNQGGRGMKGPARIVVVQIDHPSTEPSREGRSCGWTCTSCWNCSARNALMQMICRASVCKGVPSYSTTDDHHYTIPWPS